ncbi:helix-turn-helix domain-containing protein [Polaribacter glomeratus]|uniref:DNA-binding protein n=1 Tax=Polaribacter glomeratus TaxID=102 RepID=A0A2S7WGH9_9FLAO|nr:helix-turn-helix domain-containing protein [Polaribacter glomeratus]PQJ76723.1 DNA-binding protein [Polaribacter glomeratus]TXD67435.1 AraC family transcriptional regulator [Polaribacter glomeratus]
MENLDVSDLIRIIATCISLLLAFFIFSVKSTNKISNKIFAAYLVLSAFEYTSWSLFLNITSNIIIFKSQLSYLIMPIFYLYILSVCYSDFTLKRKQLWHLTPYIIGNLVMTPRFYLSNPSEKLTLFENYNSQFEIIYLHFSLHIQFAIYIILGFIVLKRAKKIFVENYSSATIQTYNWLLQLLVFIGALFGVAFVKNLFKYFGDNDYFQISEIVLSIVTLYFVCWYGLKIMKHPNLFNGVDSKTKLTTELNKEDQKNNIDLKEVEQLTAYMKTEKPYLNPSLSIRNLAEEIEMNSRDLSVLINQHLNQHFFDFVNEYRITEAMEILKNPSKKEVTVLEILYEVGFNSKSSFNTAFKKHTGLTPTEYRKTA